MISVKVNGEPREVPEGATVATLVEELALPEGTALAVELNRRIVPRSSYDRQPLAADDRLEIVTVVGGG